MVTNKTAEGLSVTIKSPFFDTNRTYLEPVYVTPLIARIQIGGIVADGSIGIEDDGNYSAGSPFGGSYDAYSSAFASPSVGRARMWLRFLVRKKSAIWFMDPTVDQVYGPTAGIIRAPDGKTRILWRHSPWAFAPGPKWLLWAPNLGKCLAVPGFEGWGLMQNTVFIVPVPEDLMFLSGNAPRGGWWQAVELRGFLGWNSIGMPFRN